MSEVNLFFSMLGTAFVLWMLFEAFRPAVAMENLKKESKGECDYRNITPERFGYVLDVTPKNHSALRDYNAEEPVR